MTMPLVKIWMVTTMLMMVMMAPKDRVVDDVVDISGVGDLLNDDDVDDNSDVNHLLQA